MVSKEKFLEFITLVKENEKAVSALENSLDSYSITNWEELYDYYSFIPGQK